MSTSLYNPMTVLGKAAKAFEHPYKGKVVQVDNDPNYIGRIKVDIPELYGDFQEGQEGILPWIYPRYYSNFSGRVKLDIPEKGDTVEVIFPYKNVYLGYYTNEPLIKSCWDDIASIDAEAAAEIKAAFLNDYPNVYGTFDRNLTGWYIDKATNEIVLFQGKTKAKFRIDTEGSLHGYIPKSMYLDIVEDVEINVGNNVTINIGNDTTTTIGNNLDLDVGTKITTHVPDAQSTVDNTLTFKATTVNSTITTTNNKGTVNNNGPVNITGTLTATVDAIANGISLVGHVHPYTWTDGAGSSNTSPPKK